MLVFFYNKEEMDDNEFDWFFQVSSEEEQEKPGNFIQGKPRMSLVRRKNNALQKTFDSFTLYKESICQVRSYRHTWKSRANHFLRYTDVSFQKQNTPSLSDVSRK